MKNEIRFGAPWSPTLKVITLSTLALLAGGSVVGQFVLTDSAPLSARAVLTVLPLIILIGVMPFMVRGYVLSDSELWIERLGWRNRVPLGSVVSADIDPEAMKGSLRLCGSGGLFGFFGWFRNRKLGVYRAYCTDPKLGVVLKLVSRTIVVTPDDPGRFVKELERRRPR